MSETRDHATSADTKSTRYTAGHLTALRRFSFLITAVTIIGHAFLGFEQSYAQPLVALATAYLMQLTLESIDAWSQKRKPRYLGGLVPFVDFMLSAHITGLAVAMLMYFNDHLWSVAFASAVAVGSKAIFRAPVNGKSRHFFNPSNFGITVTLIVCPWVGLVPPWQFTQNVSGVLDWLIPAALFISGTYLNATLTKRIPLIVGWLLGWVLQALARWALLDASLPAMLGPMTGVAFLLFTVYMAPDPATTPSEPKRQFLFGLSIAGAYFVLMALHIVFALFVALTIVCAVRGAALWVIAMRPTPESAQEIPRPATTTT